MFAPHDNITRAQFADVPAGQYYTGAVESLANLGYINGYDDGKFHPGDAISCQDMYLIAYRYLSDNDMLAPGWGTNIKISDFYVYDDYVRQAIDVLYARSMVNNWETPSNAAKRIEAADFLFGVKFYAEDITRYYEQT